MAEIKGAQLIAESLKRQGIQEVFGVMGYPVVEVAYHIQEIGIRYIGTRHEQAAGFAAQAVSYLRRRVGVALTITGPGMTNALTALGNAWVNGWAMLLISGSSDLSSHHRGAFQEAPQLAYARPFCKWVGRASRVEDIPRLVDQAIRKAWYGRPGPVYLDVPADVINAMTDEKSIEYPPPVPPPPRMGADPEGVLAALEILRDAARPLLLIGKGAVLADAAPELGRFVQKTGIPVLPSPMGKGVIPDDDPNVVSAARSYALKNADAILLAGARLNWIFHFGQPPRFDPGVKVIQIDIEPEELGANVLPAVGLAGDLKTVMGQMVARLEQDPWHYDPAGPWKKALAQEAAKKSSEIEPHLDSDDVPMGYYRPLKEIGKLLPRDALLVAEGANTMDISRSVLKNYFPGHRLDAGSWGTMGVGTGFALAAAVVHPEKRVVALMGDGAFGFSGLEVEVAVRYKLPIIWIVFNNNGIGGGVARLPDDAPPPVNAYLPGARYDKVMEAFGGRAYHCESPGDLAKALKAALSANETALIHVPIEPTAQPAYQRYAWLG